MQRYMHISTVQVYTIYDINHTLLRGGYACPYVCGYLLKSFLYIFAVARHQGILKLSRSIYLLLSARLRYPRRYFQPCWGAGQVYDRNAG